VGGALVDSICVKPNVMRLMSFALLVAKSANRSVASVPECASAKNAAGVVFVAASSAVCACWNASVFSVAFAGLFRFATVAAIANMRPAITSSGECMPARMRFSPSSRPREIISVPRSGKQ
jgi:hypothetical protein